MNVLVAGGAGFIGSHISKALERAGFTPVVLDNFSTGHRRAVKWGPAVEADLLDRAAVDAAFREHRIGAAIHTAGCINVGESVENPRKYFRNNVTASLNLLDACVDHGVEKFVFSSSCTIYGMPQRVPLDETHPQSALSPYGETKLAVERMLPWYASAYGLRPLALRYFNAAGADLEGELGEEHNPETHLIPLAIFAALGRDPLRVLGSDYPTPDGTAIRDYVHVTDLADAHVRALAYSGAHSALNLGTGTGHSVREAIACVERIGGRPVRRMECSRRPGDAPALVADAALARNELGWTPKHSDLESIVGTAWNWFSRAHG